MFRCKFRLDSLFVTFLISRAHTRSSHPHMCLHRKGTCANCWYHEYWLYDDSLDRRRRQLGLLCLSQPRAYETQGLTLSVVDVRPAWCGGRCSYALCERRRDFTLVLRQATFAISWYQLRLNWRARSRNPFGKRCVGILHVEVLN